MKTIAYIIIFTSLISCSEKREKNKNISIKPILKVEQKKSNEIEINNLDYKILSDTTDLFFVNILKTKKDTLVDYDFLSKDFVSSAEIKFNYPKLENKIIDKNNLILSNDTIEVILSEVKFDPSKHKLIYEDSLKVPKKYGLIKIDGKEYYGTDGEMPKTEIGTIKVKYNNKQTVLNSEYIKNLCNIGLNRIMTNVYIANNRRLILTFWASDGAGAYFTALFIKNGKVEHRIIDYGF